MSLEAYNTKRNFDKTAEPAGKKIKRKEKKLSFVVQRHKASRLHYDFRLEMDGVLKSWAVPKGPSLNPHDKRLAMMVEDHPYEYKDFSGVIPDGNYGAGIVEIWDSGTYISIEDTGDTKEEEKLLKAGLAAGNLKIKMEGKKLKGEFALVKLKNSDDNSWLLIKHNDHYAVHESYDSEEHTLKDSPINKLLSGQTPVVKQVKKKGLMANATPTRKLEEFIPAMLAKDTDKPFSKKDWIYEVKWDGYRAIAEIDNGKVKLYSRNGNSFLSNYPTIVEELSTIKAKAVFDGEVVVINEHGKPDFQKLQHFEEYNSYPLHYYVFDLLELNGKKLYSVPLIERKELLEKTIPVSDIIKYSDHVEERGEDFFEIIQQRDLEGIMAKRKSSEYYPGKRSADWLKIKHHKSEEVIIAGFTAPRGGRKYFGALVLGKFVNNQLTYIGHTGSGFDSAMLKDISDQLQPLITPTSPFAEKVKTNMPVTWVKPKLLCEVKFTEVTSDGKLRHPIFLRMRDDKQPGDIKSETTAAETMDPNEATKTEKEEIKNGKIKTRKVEKLVGQSTPAKKEIPEKHALKETTTRFAQANSLTKKKQVADNSILSDAAKKPLTETLAVVNNEKEKTYKFGKAEIKTTNRTKVFFPDEGITKGDVVDYYEIMAPLILPHIKDRPQSLFRTPNGINQKGFFHKDAGDEVPSWVKHIPLYSDSVKKDIDYILCNNAATLLYLANLGCIEINPWHSRLKSLDKPDYLIIDIDPSDNNTFDQVIETALVVKRVLDQAEAMSICKTSGASGMHIYVPLGAKYSYDQAKDFANIVCMLANAQIPEFTTLERSLSKRSKDQIYMDYLQNRKGQTIACVYSLRPKKGATVSTPLDWNEVKKGLVPQQFTIQTIPERIQKKGDLFAPMLDPKNAINLSKCISRLGG